MDLRRTAVLLCMTAISAALPSAIANPNRALTYQGVFEDRGMSFELFTPGDTAYDPASAYQQYLSSLDSTITIDEAALASQDILTDRHGVYKRGYDPLSSKYPWLNCTFTGTFVGGCNKNHKTAPKPYYNAVGFSKTRDDISVLLKEAFGNETRGRKEPRSICKTHDGNNLCISWSRPVHDGLEPQVQAEMVDFAMQCVGPSGLLSSQYHARFQAYNEKTDTAMASPQGEPVLDHAMLCISNRAKGCTRAPWFCADLYLKDPEESRSQKQPKSDPEREWEPLSHTPWAVGPCTENCDQL